MATLMTPEQAQKLLTEMLTAVGANSANTAEASAMFNNIPKVFEDTVAAWDRMFAPVVVAEVPKKKRRKRPEGAKPLGWPAGVSRADYNTWKDAQIAEGVTEGLNPHAYAATLTATATVPTAPLEPAPDAATTATTEPAPVSTGKAKNKAKNKTEAA